MAGAPSLCIWSTSRFLLWDISTPTGSYNTTFPVVIWAKGTPIQNVFQNAINFWLVRHLWRPPPPCFNMKSCWTVFICRFTPHKIIHSGKGYYKNVMKGLWCGVEREKVVMGVKDMWYRRWVWEGWRKAISACMIGMNRRGGETKLALHIWISVGLSQE